MAKTRVEITKKDIKAGKRFLCNQCPVAIALKRELKEEVYIGYNDLIVKHKQGRPKTIKISRQLGDILRTYDAKGKMKPFVLEIEIDH